jgi:hypothetical protein
MGPGFVKVGAEAGRREGGGSSQQKREMLNVILTGTRIRRWSS